MDSRVVILLLCMVIWSPHTAGRGLVREKRDHVPPAWVRTFLRDSVEHVPHLLRAADHSSAYTEINTYGTKSLPLRTAVETIPDKTATRLPLRDAVERRPSPDHRFDIDIDIEPDIPTFIYNRQPEKTAYAPYMRLQEAFGITQPIPAPYRVGNRFQQLVNIGYRDGRSRNLNSEAVRLHQANVNLNEKYQYWPRTQTPATEDDKRILCYIEGVAAYRKEPLGFHARDLNPHMCTHVVYAFATIDPHGYGLMPHDHEYDVVKGGFRAVTGLKRANPELKILISIGDDRQEGAHKYSNMVSTASRRREFIRSVIQFLEEFGFDGVDLHWQYPGAEELGGRVTDKMNLNLLLEELSEIFQTRDWILSMSVPASRFRIEDGYDVPVLSSYVDFVNLQAYDFHIEKDPVADHHSPLTKRTRDTGLNVFFNVDYAIRYWLKRGMARSKLNLGVAFYGRSFTLRFPNNTEPGAGVRGPGREGFYTQIPGLLAYYEICDMVLNEGWHTAMDDVGSPYAFSGNQWTGYENPASIAKKMLYIKNVGLGGVSVWAADLDDFQGLCGEKYPLLNTVKRALTNNGVNFILETSTDSTVCGKGDGLYSDPSDCARYSVCRAGLAYRLRCNQNMMFDANTGKCAYIGADRCRPGQTVHIPTSKHYLEEVLQSQQLRADPHTTGPKIVCYMTNWAFYRKAEGKFVPEHLDTRLCTHIIYAFASLEPEHLMIKEFDPWADLDNNLYERVTSLPDTTVLLALGGWTDSTGDKYSKLVSDGSARRRFVLGAVSFLRRHGFQGLHIDWNYPVCWQSNCNKGPASDKPNFTKLIQELRTDFIKQNPPLMLAAAISGYKEVIDVAYELRPLGEALDFMSVMSYDYHGHWERRTGHVSPLYHRQGDKYPQYNTNFTMEYLVAHGAPRDKLLLGVPFYGQSFTLPTRDGNPDQGTPSSGPGEAGEFSKQPGMLAYYEICNRVRSQRWMVTRDPQKVTGPYAYYGDQWVGFEDAESVADKAKYITSNGYGGAVAWTVDLDDFSNRCCLETYPLLKSLNRGLGLLKGSAPVGGDCTKPVAPVTPPAPTLTTGIDSGAMSSTTPMTSTSWPSWSEKPTTTTTTTTEKPTTTAWWTTTAKPTTTTRPPSTSMVWWQQPSTEQTTTSPWWTTATTTTAKPIVTTSWWSPSATTTTTSKPTTTEKPITTTNAWWNPTESTTMPAPAVVMPAVEDPMEGPQCIPGTYEPDPSNCNAYYHCVLGERRKQKCAGELHWNKERLVCDWPAEAKCREEHQAGTSARPSYTTGRTTTMRMPTTHTMTTCTTGQYYPHAECNQFYVCVNGILVNQKCGPGLQWSVEQNSCDWSFRIKCAGRKGYTKYNVITQYKNKPKSPCESGSYSPHAEDCSQYMMCLWGKYETFSCANGLNWNNEKQICDWPEAAKCDGSGNVDSPPTTAGNHWEHVTTPKPTVGWDYTTMKPTTTTLKPSTTTQTPEPLSGYYKIVCYFTNWAWYRRGLGKYTPEHIDPNLCTHIVYGFAVLDYENLIVKAHDSWADFDNKFYERVVAYKAKGLKVSLALGGWNDSAGDKYSRLVNNPAARARFIKHVLEFLEKYNFDGLDLDWEYPKCWQVDCTKGPDSDKPAFAAFITELHAAFKPKGYLLSAATSPSKTVIDAGYDVPALAKNLDWVAVMTYDFHGQWDKKTGHVAPLYLHPDDDVTFFNANFSINYWISEGVPRRKIVMGMPLYGQSFQLEKAAANTLNCKAPGPGQAGEFTRAAGFLAYYEICDRILNKGWTVVQDPEHRMGPYAYKGNQWVSFDDREMIRRKSEYIRQMNLGGGMVWALDLDDFRDRCGQGVHPLMNVIRDVLKDPGHGAVQPVTSEAEPPSVVPLKPTKPTKPPTYLPPITTTMKQDIPQTTTTLRPVIDPNSEYKVVCYFTNWAWYRQSGGKFLPSDIDPDLCTHIVYGFAVLNGDQLIIKPHDSWADFDNKFYEKVTAFREKGIKVLIAIGGWNDSAGDKYSKLVNNPSARRRFIAHVMDFIETNNFDGLDLDWEYPKCWQVDCNKGPASDKPAFSAFVKELYDAFKPKGWLLSAAVSPSKKVIDAGYDVPALSKYLDWIAVMCYDYHGQWDKITGHVAPMYVHPEDVDVTFNANFTIHYWIAQGADRKKLVMGMPMYGQSFSLADNNKNGLNAATYGGGEAGDNTRARGFLSYYEICQNIQKRGWKVVRDRKGRIGPYAYLRDQWVSFDDVSMIQYKSQYIKAMGLGGGMIWALDLDDFKNWCGCEEYPLLKTINRVLRGYPDSQRECQLSSSTPATTISPYTPVRRPDSKKPDTIDVHAMPSCEGRLFVTDDGDCSKYFLCNQGQLMHQQCPSGLYWNKDHCDWPENTECSAGAMPKPTTTTMKPVYVDVQPTKPPAVITTMKPSRPGTGDYKPVDSKYKIVCYFTNWAWYRQGDGKYKPEDIDTSLCTHITYGFAVLDSNSLTIKPHDSWADIDNEFYHKVTALRAKGIKVLIAIGGWNDSLGNKYSRLVNDAQARARFVTHVAQFIEKWGFDGLDLDWEYPKCWQVDCTKGPDSDKSGFASLVTELSAEFKPRGWLLSSAVSPSKAVIDAGYDVPVLAQHFDWIAVMTYDFHGHWDKQTGHVAPLYYYRGDTYDYFNANFSLHYWMEKGAPAHKLIMGMPLYGQSFSLADTSKRGLNSKSYGPGEAGEFTRAGGFLAFYEICERVKRRGWTVTRDPEGRIGPYAYSGNQWVSYDDIAEIRRKSQLVKDMGLGGGMIWALDLDDFRDRCGCGKHPLLKTMNQELRGGNYGISASDCT
ncbi:Chitinase 10 [Carabus blaptoides fortunei]